MFDVSKYKAFYQITKFFKPFTKGFLSAESAYR
ncbi:hypothetical protein GA0116948_10216 [Chitinophaga costaii]|uniref:Uncharacterized protein n=1 Tax=Chitinophaga costaii TaxID=1335309 RepID=A0A1C4A8J2_9BACT|nr:hypothetical protein GA0116948_10216 [Chitinophaga costaii]